MEAPRISFQSNPTIQLSHIRRMCSSTVCFLCGFLFLNIQVVSECMTLAEKPPQEMGGQSTRGLRPGAQRSPESCDSKSTNDGRILRCFTMSYLEMFENIRKSRICWNRHLKFWIFTFHLKHLETNWGIKLSCSIFMCWKEPDWPILARMRDLGKEALSFRWEPALTKRGTFCEKLWT